MGFDFEKLQKLEKLSERLAQSKEYLTTLSTNENGKRIATKKDILINILSLVDEKGIEKTIQDLGVPPFWIDEIVKNRMELEQDFKLVQTT